MLLAILLLVVLNLLLLIGGIITMAVTLQQFETDFTKQNTDTTAFIALVSRLLAAYLALQQGQDFTQLDQASQAADASIATQTQAINAAGIQ